LVLFEATICDLDKVAVESILRNSGLVAANEQNRSALHVECKGNPPCAAIGAEAKLLHVRMLRSLQRIDLRSTELGPELPEQSNQRVNVAPDRCRKSMDLRRKIRVERNHPRTIFIML